MNALLHQIGTELRLTLQRGESLLVAFGIPVGVLWFFGSIDLGPQRTDGSLGLTASVLAVSVMASAMVSLGIATGFERRYRVLKRLGSTPLGRTRLLTAKILAVAMIEMLQIILLLSFATLVLGTRINLQPLRLVAVVILGTSAFAGLGLLLAGSLRAEANLALCNALFLALLMSSGAVVPVEKLPAVLRTLGGWGPVVPLAQGLASGLSLPAADGLVWLKLGLWAVAAPVVAVLSFRWE